MGCAESSWATKLDLSGGLHAEIASAVLETAISPRGPIVLEGTTISRDGGLCVRLRSWMSPKVALRTIARLLGCTADGWRSCAEAIETNLDPDKDPLERLWVWDGYVLRAEHAREMARQLTDQSTNTPPVTVHSCAPDTRPVRADLRVADDDIHALGGDSAQSRTHRSTKAPGRSARPNPSTPPNGRPARPTPQVMEEQ